LHHAAGHHQTLQPAGRLELRRIEDRLDRFLAGRIDESARVDDEHVGLGGVLDEYAARAVEMPEHDLGVDEVLGAAEADDADLGAAHG
jgi:hypothetical protein